VLFAHHCAVGLHLAQIALVADDKQRPAGRVKHNAAWLAESRLVDVADHLTWKGRHDGRPIGPD